MQIRTKIKQKAVIEALKNNGADVKSACKDVNVGRTQFYDWIKKYPDFKNEVDDVLIKIERFTKTKLYLNASKNKTDALLILNRRTTKKLKKNEIQ